MGAALLPELRRGITTLTDQSAAMRRRLHGIDPWRFAAADDPEWHPDDTCLWCLEQGWATLDSASFENGDQLGSNVEQDQVVTGTGQWSAAGDAV